MKTTYQTGLQGEAAAENYLTTTHGMICLERRYRSRCGEIDLIMQDGETIVFVEVKTRKTTGAGSGLISVNPEKQRRISRSAMIYMMKSHRMNVAARFDVVEISPDGVLYVPNAFQPGGMFYH